MAKRKFKPKALLRRNKSARPDPERHGSGVYKDSGPVSGSRSLVQRIFVAVEAERTRLRKALAVLDCLEAALMDAVGIECEAGSPSYSDAVGVARGLLEDVLEGLDRVNLEKVSRQRGRQLRHAPLSTGRPIKK